MKQVPWREGGWLGFGFEFGFGFGFGFRFGFGFGLGLGLEFGFDFFFWAGGGGSSGSGSARVPYAPKSSKNKKNILRTFPLVRNFPLKVAANFLEHSFGAFIKKVSPFMPT